MGKMVQGYGSEWHLFRYMGRHRNELNHNIICHISKGKKINWLDFEEGDKEHKGLEFLDQYKYKKILDEWRNFWPQTGNLPNWDAVGWLFNYDFSCDLLLVEAKAHLSEIKSDCQAGEESLHIIKKSLDKVKADLSIKTVNDWTRGYYQFSNRLAVLWFLNNQGLSTRLIQIYFMGDNHEGTNCPKIISEWEVALKQQDQYLGLYPGHPLEKRIHKLFLKV